MHYKTHLTRGIFNYSEMREEQIFTKNLYTDSKTPMPKTTATINGIQIAQQSNRKGRESPGKDCSLVISVTVMKLCGLIDVIWALELLFINLDFSQ